MTRLFFNVSSCRLVFAWAMLAFGSGCATTQTVTLGSRADCRHTSRRPLAFDNAISRVAAKTKGIVPEVMGEADILLVFNREAGNILAQQLTYFPGADTAGLILAARAPIVLTRRSDNLRTRLASAALAKLVVHCSVAHFV